MHAINVDKSASREEIYRMLRPQAAALFSDEPSVVANMANFCALIKEAFNFFWVGFYLVESGGETEELVLGPFQGPLACTRIQKGRGVCGTAWAEARTVVVPDVDLFPGHIACNSKSRSEIVVPLFSSDRVWAVLDIDHDEVNSFSAVDASGLEALTALLKEGQSL